MILELLELTHMFLFHVNLSPHCKVTSESHAICTSRRLLSNPDSDASESMKQGASKEPPSNDSFTEKKLKTEQYTQQFFS